MLPAAHELAAHQLVSRFVKLGVLSEITGQARHRRFRNDDYLALFSEPSERQQIGPGDVGAYTPL
jgi:hypothetical protein